MERLSFYFAQDKTHILEEQKIRLLKLKEYNISFNNNPVFCDVTEFAFTSYINDMMLGHLKRLGPKLILALNKLNFTDFQKASETLPFNQYVKTTFDIDVYGNALLTSYDLLSPDIKPLVTDTNLLSKQSNSLQLKNNHWEGLKKTLWTNSTGQRKIDENKRFMEVRTNGYDMCYGYLFYPVSANANETLSIINKYVEDVSSKALKHNRFVLLYSKKLAEIPNFDLQKLNKKADYFCVIKQNNVLHQIVEIDFQMDRGFDKALYDWLDR